MDIDQIKRECFSIISMTDQPRVAVESTIDYLHSRGYFGGGPDGYVLVPKEPTDEMRDAGVGYVTYPDAHIYCYKAMIATAPKGDK